MAEKKTTKTKSQSKAPNKQKQSNKNGKRPPGVREFKFRFDIKTIFIVIFIFLFIVTISTSFNQSGPRNAEEIPITTLISDVGEEKIEKVTVSDNTVTAEYVDGTTKKATKEASEGFITTLNEAGVDPGTTEIVIENTQFGNIFLAVVLNFLPIVLFIGLLFFFFNKARGAQDSVFSFGQSKAKKFNKDMPKVSFKDVAGIDEAKRETEEIVDFLKNSEKYKKVGARTPKGVILVGPAGTGKTLLAKAVAGEAGVPFFSIAGSEFMEMLVGIGAARVRDLFATAKKGAPAIIFIDEIDAIGRARSNGVMPAHDEREQTLNQILVEMDGFTPNEQVVVIAATNRGDLLDPALLRPGRFDRRIVVDYPDIDGRKEIISIHSKGKPFTEDIDWDRIAARTVGFSGADIENMLNEAAIHAARKNNTSIQYEDIEEAATKVKLGPEKKRLQTDYDRRITAYHEAGHAIVSHFLPHTDLVQRISIVSRGMALGFTLIPPGRDRLHISKTNLMEKIMVMMGGRAAEELVYNEITTGASNDFSQATKIARSMVVEYGMSKLGTVNYGTLTDVTDAGRPMFEQQNISQEMLGKIDHEIGKILEEAYKGSISLLKKYRKQLDAVAEALLEKENVEQDEFEKIVGKKTNGA